MGSSIKRIRYRYDKRGNRKALIDQDGGRFTYSYDAVSRITQVINPQGDRTSYSYDAAGRRTVKKLANGTRASFSYDNVGNLTRLANLKSDGATISSFNYKYDEVGNRTSVLEADGSRVTWSYDDIYQLTGEHRSGTTPSEDSYSYDAAGNRLLKIHDGARTTYAYDAANQIRWSEDASGRTTYTFDANGNQIGVEKPNGDRTTTSWDYENRTTLVEEASGIRNTMAYEPGGLRVKLEESTGTKKFVWDEQNYLAETDENDDTQVVYTNEPRVYGNLVSQRRGTDSHWYHFDAIGSTRELTNVSQTSSGGFTFNAWGQTVGSYGSLTTALRYISRLGYYYDTSGHEYYVRVRTYDPSIARWKSADGLVSSRRTLFVYVLNLPTLLVDPSGLEGELDEESWDDLYPWLPWVPQPSPPTPTRPLPFELEDVVPILALNSMRAHALSCAQLEKIIRGFIPDDNGRRAWDRFVSGTGSDIILGEAEAFSAAMSSAKFRDAIKAFSTVCGILGRGPFHFPGPMEDTLEDPWAAAIGGVSMDTDFRCHGCCLFWRTSINDPFDFDPLVLFGNPTHRTPDAEIKVTLVWLAQVASQCGWKTFSHIGTAEGTVCPWDEPQFEFDNYA